MAGTGDGRERLQLEDFELPDGKEFEPVSWLNMRLARSNVPFDNLTQHLSSLGTSCQLLCQDTSESIEVAANQLVTQLPSTSRDLERMQQEAVRGRAQLGGLLEGLSDHAEARRRSGLQRLAEIDGIKTRVEAACSALREVGSWERKVRECDSMVHSGNLPAALSQLAALKDVLDAFKMLPEYPKKEEQLAHLQDNLVEATKRKARQAVERNSANDFRACCEVFVGMKKGEEPVAIANNAFRDFADKAWQSKGVRPDTAANELAAAVLAVFEAIALSLEDRSQLLQILEQSIAEGAPGNSNAQSADSVVVSAIRASLAFLGAQVETRLRGGPSATDVGSDAHATDSDARALALLAAHVDGCAALAKCSPLADEPELWLEVCRDTEQAAILPWTLLREVSTCVILRPLQDDALAMTPPVHGQMVPSEAVLAAESNARRLLQMPSSWARRLENQGVTQLATVWLACVDVTCAAYWGRWDALIATFQNTLQGKLAASGAHAADAAFDAALLQECVQLHAILHDGLAPQFTDFRAEVLRLAAQMHAMQDSPFGIAVKEKLSDPKIWCERLAVPSSAALEGAHASLEGTQPDSAAVASRATTALSASTAALAEAEKQVRGLVTQCCVQPVLSMLSTYTDLPEWSRNADAAEALPVAGGPNPLQGITAVGEHLFSLVPQLERSQDRSQSNWLPTILEAVVEVTLQKAMQIKQLGNLGAQQLAADLEYLQKVTQALGSGAPAQASGSSEGGADALADFLQALEHLSKQRQRQLECAAKGETFAEEIWQGALPLNRRFERNLRAALGLE